MSVVIKKLGSAAIRVAKNSAIGGAAGYLASGFAAPSEHKASAARQGAAVGAITAGLGTVAAGVGAAGINRVARSSYGGILKLSRKIGRGTTIPEGKLVNGIVAGVRKARVGFRRIGGRVVPIRIK